MRIGFLILLFSLATLAQRLPTSDEHLAAVVAGKKKKLLELNKEIALAKAGISEIDKRTAPIQHVNAYLRIHHEEELVWPVRNIKNEIFFDGHKLAVRQFKNGIIWDFAIPEGRHDILLRKSYRIPTSVFENEIIVKEFHHRFVAKAGFTNIFNIDIKVVKDWTHILDDRIEISLADKMEPRIPERPAVVSRHAVFYEDRDPGYREPWLKIVAKKDRQEEYRLVSSSVYVDEQLVKEAVPLRENDGHHIIYLGPFLAGEPVIKVKLFYKKKQFVYSHEFKNELIKVEYEKRVNMRAGKRTVLMLTPENMGELRKFDPTHKALELGGIKG